MTTELPADIQFGVTGETLTLTCTTAEAGLTQFAFYKDGVEVQSLGSSNTYAASTAGSYYCIAANDDQSEKTAPTALVNVAFKSKSFNINHLLDK